MSANPTPEERQPKLRPEEHLSKADLELILAWRNELDQLPKFEENE